MTRFFRVVCVLTVCSTSGVQAAPIAPAAKPPAAKPSAIDKSQIDKRAVAIFDQAITGLKKYASFSLAADEYILDTSPPQERFASGSLQWPQRAKLKISGKNNVYSHSLVGRDRALFWSGDATTTIALKTQAERERQIFRVFEGSPGLALGPVSLRAGINPTHTPLVKSADYARVTSGSIKQRIASGEPVYFRVRLTRTTDDPANPLLLTYFFSKHGKFAQYARLDRLEIAHNVDGKLFRTVADFDPIFFNDNSGGSQEGMDRYVFGWEGPEDTPTVNQK